MSTRHPHAPALVVGAAYVSSIAVANWLTSRFEMVPVGFGLTATAGTYAAGAALFFRDLVQDWAGTRWVLAGIAAGTALTAYTAPSLAVATAVAFVLAELLDTAVYTPLRRHGWARASLLSGCVGALVDTVAFLATAGYPVTAQSVGGQLVGKALWATAVPVLLVVTARQVCRVVPRHPLGS